MDALLVGSGLAAGGWLLNSKKDIDFASINFNGLEYDIFEII